MRSPQNQTQWPILSGSYHMRYLLRFYCCCDCDSKLIILRRKAWKGFQGYPPKTACAAYTYLVKTWRENGTQPIDNSAQASMQMGPSQSKPVRYN